MVPMRGFRFSIWMLLLTLTVAACAGQAADPTPTAVPTLTPQPATVTPEPSPTTIPSPTPLVEPREGRVFTYYGEEPVVPNGPDARWDGKFINPGAMIYHDGRFHMFRNGFKEWPGFVGVGYMTSPDGLAWMEVQEEPVWTSDLVPYLEEGEGADVSSVVVTDDGEWVFYFHRVSTTRPGVIGRATAPSPLGPWEIDPEPVLLPGSEGEWDENGLAWPSVVRTESGWVMYYAGTASGFAGESMIGRATSADGIAWEKYDDPATAGAPFAESDPVLTPDEIWTTDGVDRARVVHTPERWVMVYQGGALIKRGLAFSDDGVRWVRHPDNPVLEFEDFPISGTMWDTALVFQDGVYYYYTEIGGNAGTDIYLAIHEGDIWPEDLPAPTPMAAAPPLPEGVKLLQLEDLLLAEMPGSPDYTGHLADEALSLGVYALPAGATDSQPAHAEDEIYYVAQGEAALDVDGERVPVGEGSLVFVRAGVPHRFEEIATDLQVLVFFSKGDSDAGDAPWRAFELDALVADLEGSGEAVPFLEAGSLRAVVTDFPPGSADALPAVKGGAGVHLVLVGEGEAAFGQGVARLQPRAVMLVPDGIPATASGLAGDVRVLSLLANR